MILFGPHPVKSAVDKASSRKLFIIELSSAYQWIQTAINTAEIAV